MRAGLGCAGRSRRREHQQEQPQLGGAGQGTVGFSKQHDRPPTSVVEPNQGWGSSDEDREPRRVRDHPGQRPRAGAWPRSCGSQRRETAPQDPMPPSKPSARAKRNLQDAQQKTSATPATIAGAARTGPSQISGHKSRAPMRRARGARRGTHPQPACSVGPATSRVRIPQHSRPRQTAQHFRLPPRAIGSERGPLPDPVRNGARDADSRDRSDAAYSPNPMPYTTFPRCRCRRR